MDASGPDLAPAPGAAPNTAAPALSQPIAAARPPADDAPLSISSLTSAAPAAGTSPGALLAASLVRSRASYFERISSGSRASTSGGSGHGSPTSCSTLHLQHHQQPGSRLQQQSASLAAHPLDPLAPHPLCTRSGELRHPHPHRDQSDPDDPEAGGSDSDMETESVDTFFDKPSYTRYGSNVELSAASTYRNNIGSSSSSSSGNLQEAVAGGSNNSNTSGGGVGSGTRERPAGGADSGGGVGCTPAAGAGAGVGEPVAGSSGYVRSMSARFGRVSAGSVGGGGGGGMDGLFDDLVAHVGALLASHPDVEAQMGMVQGLSDRLLELHAVCETLGKKEDEVEHLRGVLRELTMTRAEAIRLKVQMAESLNGLQQEYYRVLRSAQMAQGTCKQHSARAAATRKQLAEAQAELVRYKRAVGTLRDRNRRLRLENEDMAARLKVLEGVRLGGDVRHSPCYMAMMQSQAAVLY